ncbi:LysR substrate-binding domain-containing protein [Limibacter armeniacum]|uniref:hydrogen peroxide-inducible genes activator n=1 Tax=Limibacter armeniacum TaxID=466084 RepID=UPI002FE64E1A
MTLQQLQYVVALDNHRHYVKAAESCHVAQPTLTLQVKKLEEQVGLLLFDRSKQPLTPTPMGKKFILKARQILRDVEQLKTMVSDDRNEISGTFRLGIIPTLSQYLLPLFLKEFTALYPDTRLEIKEMQSEEMINTLTNGTLDLGLMATPSGDEQIREIPIFYEPFMVYAHKDHEIMQCGQVTPDDLKREGLWLLNEGHCFRNQVLEICELRSYHQNISFESGSIETLKRLIPHTNGYTLIPELSYLQVLDHEFVREFQEPKPAREISLVVHKSFTKELLLANLRKTIQHNIPEHFQKANRFITVKWR